MKNKLLLLLALFSVIVSVRAQTVNLQFILKEKPTMSVKDTMLYIVEDGKSTISTLVAVLDSMSIKTFNTKVNKRKVTLIVTPNSVLQLYRPIYSKTTVYCCYGIYFKSGSRLTWNYSTDVDHPNGWSHFIYVNLVDNKEDKSDVVRMLEKKLSLLASDIAKGYWHPEVVSSKGYN